MGLKQGIYPSGIREGCFLYIYADIAMEHYNIAKHRLQEMERKRYTIAALGDERAMNKSIMIATVFSAMAIESFLNDYAAACLGDAAFYDNFDRLSVISKFQLIAKFILKTQIDKSKAYYNDLKLLVNKRDDFVHNKPKESFLMGYAPEESEKHGEICNERWAQLEEEDAVCVHREEAKKDFQIARTAIRAMKLIADYFDEHDANISAVWRVFGISPGSMEFDQREYIRTIVKDFHIKPAPSMVP